MDRTERLLDLIASLLNAREPVPFDEIRRWFPEDYATLNPDAGARTFERDKATLLDLGVPLEYREPDEESPGGYVVDKRTFYLPPIDLSREEAAVTFVAGQALLAQEEFPYREELRLALGKLSMAGGIEDSPEAPPRTLVHHPVVGGGKDVRDRLALLSRAVTTRKRVSFTYHARYSGQTSRRRVDPYGLHCRRGQWTLVGHAHERGALRSFLVARMTKLGVNETKPRTPDFDVPADFDLHAAAMTSPRQYDAHAPVEVDIEVDVDFAWMAEQEFGVPGTPRGVWVRFRVETTNADAIVEWALGMGPRARITAPDELRQHVRRTLESALARYGVKA